MAKRSVVLVCFERVQALDLVGPWEVFTEGGHDHYALRAATPGGGQFGSSSGLRLIADDLSRVRGPVDTLLVAGGLGVHAACADPAFLSPVRRLAATARRVGSICTGAFVLAAAGLLDGRRATTHWGWCEQLAREYPRVTVAPDPIFVKDGNVYTSAGVTAGMDLALALMEEDLGRQAAMRVARQLVLFVRRPGGQSQFSAALELQTADRQPLRDLQAWIVANPAADLSVEGLAARAHMSPRNFARAFTREVGTTPARYVERVRVEAARQRLEESDAGLELVAKQCGFGSGNSMRRSFLRVVKVPPADYRVRFRSTKP
ncbi:GlxA family transcriptional regulator [Limnoglobus roseus]|uniref:GlxA family transcriptional regulator n=1 Tax=Limnoglobus roseus TaxID=2598579 RepID=A0A5C1AQA1_9BACT|nr:DJ-1/PfpI family protein [Limnoglobus roseus]QEL20795.1 GlxA family transcriptional regulator [Limnoglobus roseus]